LRLGFAATGLRSRHGRGVIFPVSLLIFLSLSAIYDRVSQGRIHPVSLWIGLLVFAWSAVSNIVIVQSAAWREFATWLIQ
jgi:hypothetical protein